MWEVCQHEFGICERKFETLPGKLWIYIHFHFLSTCYIWSGLIMVGFICHVCCLIFSGHVQGLLNPLHMQVIVDSTWYTIIVPLQSPFVLDKTPEKKSLRFPLQGTWQPSRSTTSNMCLGVKAMRTRVCFRKGCGKKTRFVWENYLQMVGLHIYLSLPEGPQSCLGQNIGLLSRISR